MKKPLTNKEGQVRELTKADFKKMRSAKEVLPSSLLRTLAKRKRGQRGPQKEPIKISVTIRYSQEVVDYFKATGDGWQTRIDTILKGYVKSHPLNKSHVR